MNEISVKCHYCGTKSIIEYKKGMCCPVCGDKKLSETKLPAKGNIFGYPEEEPKQEPKVKEEQTNEVNDEGTDPGNGTENEPGDTPDPWYPFNY